MKKTVLTVFMALGIMTANANTANGEHNNNLTTIIGGEVTKSGPDIFCEAIKEGDLGEDVNQKPLGKTLAIFAARYNKAEILKSLIKSGLDLSIICYKGLTVKKYAELSHTKEVLTILAAYGQNKK